MGRLLLTGLAALALTGCATERIETTRIILPQTQQANYFTQGLERKLLAVEETDPAKRAELIAYAISDFDLAQRFGQEPYKAKLHQAELYSIEGSIMPALQKVEEALNEKNTAEAHNTKGNIFSQFKMHNAAIEEYTEAIKLEDKPAYRWNSYEARIFIAITPLGIDAEALLAAQEDARKYIEFKKEEPDGYAALGFTQSIEALATENKELLKEARTNLEKALEMIKNGQKLQRKRFTPENIQNTIDQIDKIYKPDNEEDF